MPPAPSPEPPSGSSSRSPDGASGNVAIAEGASGKTANGELARALGLPSAIAVVVGTTIGSGIFRSPANIAREAGSLTTFFLVWIIAGLVALVGAHLRAEITRQELAHTDLIGPAPAFFSRLRGRWRWQILVRTTEPRELHALLSTLALSPGWRTDVHPLDVL